MDNFSFVQQTLLDILINAGFDKNFREEMEFNMRVNDSSYLPSHFEKYAYTKSKEFPLVKFNRDLYPSQHKKTLVKKISEANGLNFRLFNQGSNNRYNFYFAIDWKNNLGLIIFKKNRNIMYENIYSVMYENGPIPLSTPIKKPYISKSLNKNYTSAKLLTNSIYGAMGNQTNKNGRIYNSLGSDFDGDVSSFLSNYKNYSSLFSEFKGNSICLFYISENKKIFPNKYNLKEFHERFLLYFNFRDYYYETFYKYSHYKYSYPHPHVQTVITD